MRYKFGFARETLRNVGEAALTRSDFFCGRVEILHFPTISFT